MSKPIFYLILLTLILIPASFAYAVDGFFTVGQDEGRWWLYNTQNERFFSSGVNVVTPSAFYAPDLGYAPYYVNIMDLYGSEQAWSDVVVQRMGQWGFNTLGGWCDTDLLGDRVPYTKILNLSPSDWLEGDIPDYFSQEFRDYVDGKVAGLTSYVDDPMLIGYFFANELRWGADWRGLEDLFAIYFAYPEDAEGKIALVNFLKDKYDNDANSFNAVWDMSIVSFDDLLPMTQIAPFSTDPARKADRLEFAGLAAEAFFSYCHDAILAVDPNHLLLGTRFVSWVTPGTVVEAISDYTDVVSVNHYMPWPIYFGAMEWLQDTMGFLHTDDMLLKFYEATDKPILISECSIRAMDSGLPNTWPPNYFFETKMTQEERADFFENYARQTFEGGYIVGYHWFSYMDEPPEGRFDGENSNFGLVDNEDNPWQTLVTRMTAVNADAYTWPLPDDDDDDNDDNDDNDSGDDDDNDDNDDNDSGQDDDDNDNTVDDDDENPATDDDDDNNGNGCCG